MLTAITGEYGNPEFWSAGTGYPSGILWVTPDAIGIGYSESDGTPPPGSYPEFGIEFQFHGTPDEPLPPLADFWNSRVTGGTFFFTLRDPTGHGRGRGVLSSVAVPEPGSLALLGVGLGGLGLMRRRRVFLPAAM